MKTRRLSLTDEMAEQLDREAFAALVLQSEIAAPHEHVLCSHDPHCFLRDALAASTARITREGAEIVAEYRRGEEAS